MKERILWHMNERNVIMWFVKRSDLAQHICRSISYHDR